MVPAASLGGHNLLVTVARVYLISSVMPVSSLIFFPTSVLEKSSGSVLPISSTYACTVMVRSAIQVSGLSDVSSVAASEDVLLLLVDALSVLLPHPAKLPTDHASCQTSCEQISDPSLFHLVSSFLPFYVSCLPQAYFRHLFTDLVARYNQYQSNQPLYQTNCRRITELSSLQADTQNVNIQCICNRHVAGCTQQPYLINTGGRAARRFP